MDELIPIERIERQIFLIRGQKVMIDRNIAELYGVETKYLNRQVKRNIGRFPKEFMFQLTVEEKNELVTNWHQFENMKHATVLPFVFTEHGVAMLAGILRSDRAVKISIYIIKAFVRLREIILNHKELANKLQELRQRVDSHDNEIQTILDLIEKLMAPPPEKPKGRIGFITD